MGYTRTLPHAAQPWDAWPTFAMATSCSPTVSSSILAFNPDAFADRPCHAERACPSTPPNTVQQRTSYPVLPAAVPRTLSCRRAYKYPSSSSTLRHALARMAQLCQVPPNLWVHHNRTCIHSLCSVLSDDTPPLHTAPRAAARADAPWAIAPQHPPAELVGTSPRRFALGGAPKRRKPH